MENATNNIADALSDAVKATNANKVLSNFLNTKKLDKLVRVRAQLRGLTKGDIIRDALKVYFEQDELDSVEKEVLLDNSTK